MTAERYLLTTTIGEKAKRIVWDPARPAGIGHPFRWIVERADGRIRVRYLGEPTEGVQESVEVEIQPDQVQRGEMIDLPFGDAPLGPPMKMRLQALRTIRPPYLSARHSPGMTGRPLQLFAYSGIQRAMVDCQPVHSAFVAYFRGKPVFAAYQGGDGLTIKPLLSGVYIKMKGSPAIPAFPNETLQLASQKVPGATIVRGRYWWKFSFVPIPEPVSVTRDERRRDRETAWFYGVLTALFGACLLFTAVIEQMGPAPEQKIEKQERAAPLVTFKSKTVKVAKKLKPQQEKRETGSPGSASPQPVNDADQKAKRLAEKPAPSPVKRTEVKAAEKVEKVRPTAVTRTPPKKAEVKNVVQAPVLPKEIETKVIEPVPARPKPLPVVKAAPRSNPLALKEASMLKEALLGAKALVQKSSILADSPEGKALVGAKGMKASISELAPTEIKPTYSGTGRGITGIGGGAAGKSASTGAGQGEGVGYGSGTHAGLSGQGNSLVSVDAGGSRVAEGLTKEEVGAVIHSHMAEIRYCHETALLSNPTAEGKLVLSFTINGNGVVQSVSQESSTVTDGSLPPCVVRRLRTWRFPHPKGGVNVTVSYPFLFRTLDKD